MGYDVDTWGYFTQLPNQLLCEPRLTPLEKLVVAIIWQQASRNKTSQTPSCYVSQATFLDAIGCSRNALRRALQGLIEKSVIAQCGRTAAGTHKYIVLHTDHWNLEVARKRSARGEKLRASHKPKPTKLSLVNG